MTLGLVWAEAANGVLGDRGSLPWNLPEDLSRFRALTLGSTVVMGRATWESLPDPVRPLPGRRNVVLTRQGSWSAPGATPVGSLDVALVESPGDVWVIGGASVYRAALPRADRLEVTELADAFDGDVLAPPLGPGWRCTRREPELGWLESRTGLRYRTRSFVRAAGDLAPGGGR